MSIKLERAKKLQAKRATEKASKARLIEDGIKAYHDLEASILSLKELLEQREDPDLQPILEKLGSIDKRLDLTPLITSLEKTLQQHLTVALNSTQQANKTNTADLSRLIKSIKEIKPQVNVKAVDTVTEYRPANVVVGDSNSYYGFLHPTGKWYIMRQSGAVDASFKYVVGQSNYDDAWRAKENHRYVSYNEVRL